MSIATKRVDLNVLRVHQQALVAADGFRRAESALIDALMEVEKERVFVKMGYSSLFVYATQALKLSEAVSFNSIAVMRKAREVPQLHERIASGELSISKARKFLSVLTAENQEEWLGKAETLSSRQLEKEVARENPRAAVPESARYVSGKRLELRTGLDESVMIRLRLAQDQVSRSKGRAVSIEETLAVLADFYLAKNDPLEKAKRAVARSGLPGLKEVPAVKVRTVAKVRTIHGSREPLRTAIPAAIAHVVRMRDDGRCQFKQGVGICGERRWVELHHPHAVSQGGVHSIENLITLCVAHHAHQHLGGAAALRS